MDTTRDQRPPHAGLCNACRWQRVVVSGRGSAFSLCRRAAEDLRFPRYPAIPVRACAGFEGVEEAEGVEGAVAAAPDTP